MLSAQLALFGLICAQSVWANNEDTLGANLNYRSPSRQVSGPGLSYDTTHIARRLKRDNNSRRAGNKNPATALDATWDPSFGPYGEAAFQGAVKWDHGVASGDPYPGESAR